MSFLSSRSSADDIGRQRINDVRAVLLNLNFNKAAPEPEQIQHNNQISKLQRCYTKIKVGKLTVEGSPPFGGRGIPFYLSQFVSILGNLYPDQGVKGPFLGMFRKMDLCKKILIQAYTSLI